MPLKKTNSNSYLIKKHIIRLGRGAVFTPSDFVKELSHEQVYTVLGRLTKQGFIRRLAKGLYDYPKNHEKLGLLFPDLQKVAAALAKIDNANFQASGALAANQLGLTTQVPAKMVYLTDKEPRKVKIGNQEIQLKVADHRQKAVLGRFSGLLFQALRYLGKDYLDTAKFKALQSRLSNKEIKELSQDIRYASPEWIADVARKLFLGNKNE